MASPIEAAPAVTAVGDAAVEATVDQPRSSRSRGRGRATGSALGPADARRGGARSHPRRSRSRLQAPRSPTPGRRRRRHRPARLAHRCPGIAGNTRDRSGKHRRPSLADRPALAHGHAGEMRPGPAGRVRRRPLAALMSRNTTKRCGPHRAATSCSPSWPCRRRRPCACGNCGTHCRPTPASAAAAGRPRARSRGPQACLAEAEEVEELGGSVVSFGCLGSSSVIRTRPHRATR